MPGFHPVEVPHHYEEHEEPHGHAVHHGEEGGNILYPIIFVVLMIMFFQGFQYKAVRWFYAFILFLFALFGILVNLKII